MLVKARVIVNRDKAKGEETDPSPPRRTGVLLAFIPPFPKIREIIGNIA